MSYYDNDPWSVHELNEIKCAECGEHFDQQDKEGGNICPVCINLQEGETVQERADRTNPYLLTDEKEGKQMETYFIALEITTETDPNEWDWGAVLDLNPVTEDYKIHSIGQITRNKIKGENK